MTTINFREIFYAVYGRWFGPFFIGRREGFREGEYGSVGFDYNEVIKRHTELIGFYHTHPPTSFAVPSMTDDQTMRNWGDTMGRRLLCAIECDGELNMWFWDNKKEEFYLPYGFIWKDYVIGFDTRWFSNVRLFKS